MCKPYIYIEIPLVNKQGWAPQGIDYDNPEDIKKIMWFDILEPQEIDACIALDVYKMNNQGIKTLSSCCGHGKPLGEYDGEIMIDSHSVYKAICLGYDVRKFNALRHGNALEEEDESPLYMVKLKR